MILNVRRPAETLRIVRRAAMAAGIMLLPASCRHAQTAAPATVAAPAVLVPAASRHAHSAASIALSGDAGLIVPSGSFASWLAQTVNRITITPQAQSPLVFNVATAQRTADWSDSFDGISQITHVLRQRQSGYEVLWMFTPAPHDGGPPHCYYIIERQRAVLEGDYSVSPQYSCRIEDAQLSVDVTRTIGDAPAFTGFTLEQNPPSGTPKHGDFARWYHQSRAWPNRPVAATHAQIINQLYPRHGAPSGMSINAAGASAAYVPLAPCGLYRNMRQGGWRRDIGPISEDWARFLALPSTQTLSAALALSHGSFAAPIHLRDSAGGIARFDASTAAAGYILESYYIAVNNRPKGITTKPRATDADSWVNGDWHCWALDTAHKQSHAHLAWLMTRSPLWREEAAFEAMSAIALSETAGFAAINRLSTLQERDGLRSVGAIIGAIHAAPAQDTASMPSAAAYQAMLTGTLAWWKGNILADPFGGLNLLAYVQQQASYAPWEVFNDPPIQVPSPLPSTQRKLRYTTVIADEAVAVMWRGWKALGLDDARTIMIETARKHVAQRVLASGLYSANQSQPTWLWDVTNGVETLLPTQSWAQSFAHIGLAASSSVDKAGWRNPKAPDAYNSWPAGRTWGEGPAGNAVQYPIYATQLWGMLQLAHDVLQADCPQEVIDALKYCNRQFTLAVAAPASINATAPDGTVYQWSPRPSADGYQFSYHYPASIAL